MTGKVIDGKEIARKVREDVANGVASFKENHGKAPRLDVILIGDDPASKVYVGMKDKAAAELGMKSVKHEYHDIEEKDLIALVKKLDSDDDVNGILVQLPLPRKIDEEKVLSYISPEKDVDGFLPKNLGLLCRGKERLLSCTPYGVIKMLEHEGIETEGKEAVVIGRSNIVGKPMALMLLNRNATVTICHTRTKDLASHTRRADILVAAAGSPKLIKADMVKDGAVVIDVGTSKVDGKLCGDVDFEAVKEKASHITPVPGGVGPMTIAMLMHNTLQAAKSQMEGRQ